MAKKSAAKVEDDFLTTFRARWEDSYERLRDNIDLAYEDLSFAEGEGQWEESVRREREEQERPCLTVNRLPTFVRQITGKMRQMRPSIKCVPVDSRGDPKTAEVLAGMFRYIENRSRALSVYGRAVDSQVTCGIGAWRIETEYSDDQTFNQEIRISPIDDPVMVLFDPDATLPSKSDAMFCFVPVDMSLRRFNEEYPGKFPADVGLRGEAQWLNWVSEDYVRVCEYWYKEPMKRRLVLMPDGSVEDLTGKSDEDMALVMQRIAELAAKGIEVRIEDRDSYRIMRALVTSQDVLEEPTEWPGRYFPIIPVIGEEVRIGRKVVRRGVVRLAKDPQRMYNYFSSAETEIVALQPKAPFIATETNIENYQDIWETANSRNHPALIYTPDPKNGGAAPQRSQPPVASQGLMEGAARSVEDMKAVIGIYDASLGNRSNETSGRAIEARDQQGDTGSYVYLANFEEAMNYSARVIMDLIPRVYDTARTIRIVGEDGTVEPAQINMPQGVAEGGVAQIQNDVTIGAYDVVLKMGPAYDSLRSEAREGMTAMIQSAPDVFPVVGDLLAKMQDWPYADELAERLEAIAPPAIKAILAEKRGEAPEPPPPSPQEQEMQAKMAMAQQEAQLDAQIAQIKAQNEIETARIKLEGEMQLKREQAMLEMALKREIAAEEMQLKREQAALDAELKQMTAVNAAQIAASRAAQQPNNA